jgi:hemoglobin
VTVSVSPLAESLSEPVLAELVRRFYAGARLDPLLGPVFDAAVDDWDAHIAKVTAFWASALMGARGYRGNPLAEHRKQPLTPEMFPRWLKIWGETVDAMLAPDLAEPVKARAELISESLKLGLFFKPD